MAMPRRQTQKFPVTVTRLPVTRCDVCQQPMAHQPGRAGEVLTEHYQREHADYLAKLAEEAGR